MNAASFCPEISGSRNVLPQTQTVNFHLSFPILTGAGHVSSSSRVYLFTIVTPVRHSASLSSQAKLLSLESFLHSWTILVSEMMIHHG